ncbi:MAG: hypothetical protein ABI743_01405 [bacterium]
MSHSLLHAAARLGLAVLVSAAVGCSASTPNVPASNPASTTVAPEAFVPLATGSDSMIAPLALASITLDIPNQRGTLTPLTPRSGAAFTPGDSLIPDLTKLFTDPAALCGDCMELSQLGLDPVTLQPYVDLTVRHPIPTGRPDLSAFDVQGVLISDDLTQTLVPIPQFGVGTYGAYLANADGLTGQITPAVEAALGTPLSADLFPFKNFATDATAGNFAAANVNGFADVLNPSGHNVFASGDTSTVRYQLDLNAEPHVNFVFALTASFYRSYTAKGSALTQKNNPIYFLPEGNRKEAWQVTATAGSALIAGDTASTAALDVTIYDWQNGLTAQASGWNPIEPSAATQPRDAIPATSDVSAVEISVPGVTSAVINATALAHSGTGRLATDPLVYSGIPIPNSAAAPSGTYLGVVRVTDSRTPEPATPGEGEILFRDAITIGTVTSFATYALFSVEVADDLAFVGSDFTNSGHLLHHSGSTVTIDTNHFANIGAALSNSAIRKGKVYVVSAGPSFSGNGVVQVYDLASGAELLNYALPLASNPWDIAFLSDTEAYITGFLTDSVYRVNIDPAFVGTRLLATIPLNSVADPGFNVRPTEIIRTAGGRVFATGDHLDPSYVPAPAGLLIEINPATNAIVNGYDTTGRVNAYALVEIPGQNKLIVTASGGFGAGDGGSGTFNLTSNIWAADPNSVPARDWSEIAVNSAGRGFVTDSVLATVDHVGLPFTGTINHVLSIVPPATPFPYTSDVSIDREDALYVCEFGTGTIKVFDTASATAAIAPTVIATFTVDGGTDAIGVAE